MQKQTGPPHPPFYPISPSRDCLVTPLLVQEGLGEVDSPAANSSSGAVPRSKGAEWLKTSVLMLLSLAKRHASSTKDFRFCAVLSLAIQGAALRRPCLSWLALSPRNRFSPMAYAALPGVWPGTAKTWTRKEPNCTTSPSCKVRER